MRRQVSAVFSPDRRYRYILRRTVGLGLDACLFIMLNPSTADETQDDPTVRRCIGYARRWGFGVMGVANIFALRSTDPRLLAHAGDPIGPDNDAWLVKSARYADTVVCAWVNWGQLLGRGEQVRTMLTDAGVGLQHLGLTGRGQPRHPLYLARDQERLPLMEVQIA